MSDLVEKVARAIAEHLDGGTVSYPLASRAAIAAVAEWLKPTRERPCDCRSCYCGNTGDAENVAYWDADNWRYFELMKQLEQPK